MRKLVPLRVAWSIVLITIALQTAGCGDERIVKSIQEQRSELDSVKKELADLKLKQSINEVIRHSDGIAYLTPGTDGYVVVQMDLGRLTVSIENIQTYANGSRISLRFGNTTNATINGAKAKLEWGKMNQKGYPDEQSTRTRDVTFVQSLRAGAWTTIPIFLEGVPPAELGFVRVQDVKHSGISLAR